jgi:transcriptional regulator with XRE-family HTH domain
MTSREVPFGKRLKRIRLAAGLPLEALEWHTDLSRQYIHDLEQGKRNPSSETIDALARALLVTPNSLRGKEEPEITDLSKHWKVARKKALAIVYERAAFGTQPKTEAERVAWKWMIGMSQKFAKEAERMESELHGPQGSR